MDRNRYEEVGDNIIEEYWWNGKLVVYVNNFLTYETFEQACEKLKERDGINE
jgi:hypothetical protein